ncbi:MAG TPA: hypothetical protein DEB25_06410 [Desulfobulbaceae bacterium]|nr:hypothetical protein [Desulfobulbaceae bacterium]
MAQTESPLETYQRAVKLYRILFCESSWQMKTTFLGLQNHIRDTRKWPTMEYLMTWTAFTAETIQRHMFKLEQQGFINLATQQLSFPVARLNDWQYSVFLALTELAKGQEQVTVTLREMMETSGMELTEEEIARGLNTLKKRKLIGVRVEKTPNLDKNGTTRKLYTCLLHPSPELAAVRVWDSKTNKKSVQPANLSAVWRTP